jgi:hypothetical protein
MAEQHSADEALKNEIWKYTGKGILLASVFASGMAVGYILWADACGRCDRVQTLTADVSKARAETETVTAQWGQKYRALEREKEGVERQLAEMKAAAGGGA